MIGWSAVLKTALSGILAFTGNQWGKESDYKHQVEIRNANWAHEECITTHQCDTMNQLILKEAQNGPKK